VVLLPPLPKLDPLPPPPPRLLVALHLLPDLPPLVGLHLPPSLLPRLLPELLPLADLPLLPPPELPRPVVCKYDYISFIFSKFILLINNINDG
jgi:hypothetical protein